MGLEGSATRRYRIPLFLSHLCARRILRRGLGVMHGEESFCLVRTALLMPLSCILWSTSFLSKPQLLEEEEIQLFQIIDIDKTTDQPAWLLDYWSPNDTLRTLALNVGWVYQSLETFIMVYSENKLFNKGRQSRVLYSCGTRGTLCCVSDSCDDCYILWNGWGPRPRRQFLHKLYRQDPVLKCIFTYLFLVLSAHHNNPKPHLMKQSFLRPLTLWSTLCVLFFNTIK